MLKRVAKLMASVLALVAFGATVFVLGMRRKNPSIVNAIRRINRDVLNPQQMESAGTPGAYASVIRHTGRASGKSYETPIGAVDADDGFLIALPYGASADWVRNVMASGSATLVHEGETYDVDHPEVISLGAVETRFPEQDQTMHKLFGVEQCLRVRRHELQEA